MKANQNQKNQYMLKLLIIGDCGVGKTNVLMRYCQNTFKMNYVSTIGVDFKIKTIELDGYKLKFQIWDTAGQQRYKNVAQTYYKGSAGILLVYSVTDQKSFGNIEKWIKQINEHAPKQVIKMLVGNKIDANEQQRQVQFLQGKTLADRFQIPFLQVSAKSGQNIIQIFQTMGEQLIQHYIPFKKIQDPGLLLNTGMQRDKDNKKKKEKKQCQC